jgi:hypothetical protein
MLTRCTAGAQGEWRARYRTGEDMARPEQIKNALAVFVDVHRDRRDFVATPEPALLDALSEHFGDLATATAATDEELAGAAFELLSDVPEYSGPLKSLAEGPEAQSFGIATTAAVVTGLLFALQTHVRFERQPNGKWSILIEKKPSKEKLLTDVIAKLLGRFGGGDKPGKE